MGSLLLFYPHYFTPLVVASDFESFFRHPGSLGNARRWQGAAENLQRMRRRFTQLDAGFQCHNVMSFMGWGKLTDDGFGERFFLIIGGLRGG